MEGVILGFDSTTNSGVIKASDDKRYKFSASDFQDKCTIQKGLKVDFVVNTTGIATEIYTIENKEDLSVNDKKNNLFSCPHCTSENTEKLSYFYFKNLALINQTSQTRTETRGRYNQYQSSSVSYGNSEGTIQSAILNKMQLEPLETFIGIDLLHVLFFCFFTPFRIETMTVIFPSFVIIIFIMELNENIESSIAMIAICAFVFFCVQIIMGGLLWVQISNELKNLQKNCLENNMSEQEFIKKIQSININYNKAKAKKYYYLVQVWKQLFLCHRCDTIFIPEKDKYDSLNELKSFVNRVVPLFIK